MDRSVYIVEDHPVMREGYRALVEQAEGLTVAGEAASGLDALAALRERPADELPDALLVDLSIPGMSGLELIKQVRSFAPDLPVMVVSAHSEALYAERALRAGAQGYLMKSAEPSALIGGIRDVLEGKLAVSDPMQRRLLASYLDGDGEAASPIESLSDRELEVFRHLGAGRATAEIAEAMLISPKTVETHRVNIKHKLGVKTTNELVQRAAVWAESLSV